MHTILCLPILLCATASPARGQDPEPRTNLVLILADDVGWKDLGCYGHPLHETPHLDRLAAEGVRSTDAYANAPNCAPSRAALMSGLYGPRTGIYTVGKSTRGKSENRRLIPTENRTVLADEVRTLAEVLGDAGYATAAIGKWHLGPDPTSQGFQLGIGGSPGHPQSYTSPYGNPSIPDGPEGEYLTDRLASEAEKFVAAHAHEPFFLYLPFFTAHTPIQGRPDLVEYYEAARREAGSEHHVGYAAMIGALDEAVGRVLAALDEHGLRERTLVVFLSDNGGHARFTDMAPLRGSKGMLYEGGIRVPMIARWPGHIPAGQVSHVPQIALDLFPTFVEVAGARAPELLDGVSLVELWTAGRAPDREALFWHFPAYLQAYLPGQGDWRTTPAGAIRVGDYKLIEYFEDGRLELYDLRDDLGESRDLTALIPGKAAELHAELVRWRKATGAPVPSTPNPEYGG